MRSSRLFAAALLLSAPLAALAQQQQRPLTQDDWDRWRSIHSPVLSPDGRWAVYSVAPQVGDGELVIRSTGGSTEYHVPRGFIGRPQMRPGAAGDSTLAPAPAQVTADSRFALALTYANKAEFDRTRKLPPARQPKASLAVVNLADGNVTSVAGVRSFRLAKEDGRFVAYQLESTDSTAGAGRATRDSSGRSPRRETGSTLVLRDLASGGEVRIADVSNYALDDSAKFLAYTVASKVDENNGVYLRSLASGINAEGIALVKGKGSYKQLAFDRAGAQLAFLSDRDESSAAKPRYALYLASLVGRTPAVAQVVKSGFLGDSMRVADQARVDFTRNGKAVLFGVASLAADSIPADSLWDKAVVDVWSWKDARLQPQQKVEAARDRNRSFQAVYQIAARRAVRLANDTIPQVEVSPDGRWAVASSNWHYGIESTWGEGGSDLYLIDAISGAAKLLKAKSRGRAQLSPAGHFVTWFDSGHWYAYDIAKARAADVSGKVAGVRFDDETTDTPTEPQPWGIAGWTTNDKSLLAYDRYDVWELDPTGAAPARIVTDSTGRRHHLVFRVIDLDGENSRRGGGRFGGGESPVFDANESLLLSAFSDDTKASGFFRDRLGASQLPQQVVMADARFGRPAKAKNGNQLLVTRETFVDFPNLYTGTDLAQLTRISDANPQQKDFKWGSVELVSYTSDAGVPLKGLLYKPADFDPSKKYPMIVYYYERLSDNLHQYVIPFGRNIINPTHYASNGYLVFEPDIVYEEGYPGASAARSILPGVQMLLARGYVDPNALGLQGQSWGGYQTMYMITQTNMFKAAMAGAPVGNMFAAYGGIRWQTGISRAGQYEHGQSRIGGTPWEMPLRFIENSPVFFADKIRTPLLIMHNDNDGAVPWYQGIELFVALRRLGREVYLLNYNGEEHNPTKRANQKDVALRMQQFFDYHLKGAPEPAWMIKGVPYQDKGRDQFGTASAP